MGVPQIGTNKLPLGEIDEANRSGRPRDSRLIALVLEFLKQQTIFFGKSSLDSPGIITLLELGSISDQPVKPFTRMLCDYTRAAADICQCTRD